MLANFLEFFIAGAALRLMFLVLGSTATPREVVTRTLDWVAPRPPSGWKATTPAVEREAGLVFDVVGRDHVMWPGYWEWQAFLKDQWKVQPEGMQVPHWVDPSVGYVEAVERFDAGYTQKVVEVVNEVSPYVEVLGPTPIGKRALLARAENLEKHCAALYVELETMQQLYCDHAKNHANSDGDATAAVLRERISAWGHALTKRREELAAVLEELDRLAKRHEESALHENYRKFKTGQVLGPIKLTGLVRIVSCSGVSCSGQTHGVDPHHRCDRDPDCRGELCGAMHDSCCFSDSPFCDVCGKEMDGY